MVDFNNIQKIYFIGIGGIGMSAIARYFKFHGKDVSGYDRAKTDLTEQLVREGIAVHYREDLGLIPQDADLVVYTPAIPKDHAELKFYQARHTEILKRSEVLGEITRSSFNVCVAGTHGKTTITTMVAFILQDSGYGCNAFLGGISVNYGTNYWSDARNLCVVEADEYDRSFLKLSPDIGVITAVDADHLDIYGTPQAVIAAFTEFAGRIKSGGLLISKFGLDLKISKTGARCLTYSLHDSRSDIFCESLRIVDSRYLFSVRMGNWKLDEAVLHIGGTHNVENAVAAIAVAHQLGLEDEKIRNALATFKGVRRRFEYIYVPTNTAGTIYIDDYAHHPQELKALISSARELYPSRKCTIIFQPHLFSRTKDFAQEFAESLDLADQVILLPIYPAREKPIEGVTSEIIEKKIKNADKLLMEKDELLNWIQSHRPQLLISAGAGDIDRLVEPIKEVLEKKN